MAAWGVGACTALPAMAQDSEAPAAEEAGEAGSDNPLLNRVWVRSDADSGLPGSMQIFLADGTLVSDSCWETYRLSNWQQVSDTEISWDEDGMTISADITSLTPDELVLTMKLVGGDEEVRFAPASVPYLCPDMPR
ncbi:hypothetical protein VE26_09165 [Devosia chinhatensis]|uniref:Uncharacterized protein n=2 Tax=Devosia chinhatensis TaxID=429727 RepID=A0A0F5FNI4_9HYPH|nr:hypothetical protein VE26_09165 [Devosia chinhatensis]